MRRQGRQGLLLALAIAAGFSALAVVHASGPSIDLTSANTIQSGQTLFSQACTNCHGNDGNGGPVPLRGRADLTPEEIFDTISNGRTRGSNLMPAWKESLSEPERWELTAFIVSMAHLPSGR